MAVLPRTTVLNFNLEINKDTGLHTLPIVVVSNQTTHERNVAFACNNKVIQIIQQYVPSLNRVFFWSDGCSSQFRSQYVFRSLSYYPDNLKITWDYGEAHHFKGPHDGSGGTVKRKVYQNVSTWKVVIKDAKHFAQYANTVCNIHVGYLDQTEIKNLNLNKSNYIYGTLQIHHVDRISSNTVEFYYNAVYKKSAKMLKRITYDAIGTRSKINVSFYIFLTFYLSASHPDGMKKKGNILCP